MFSVFFSREVEEINKLLLHLGGLVEENFRKAVQAAINRDAETGREVVANDKVIDAVELEVEEECLKAMALHQPVAKDLRYLVAVLKINNDLERIGDLAVNIAKRADLFSRDPGFQLPDTFRDMAESTCTMLTQILNAFVELDVEAAKAVLKADDEVDTANKRIYDQVKDAIEQGGGDQAVAHIHLLTIARHVERAADHVTNIAEDLLYMSSGVVVRHNKHRI